MKISLWGCLALWIGILAGPAVAAEPFVPRAGEHYELISPPVPVTGSKPEVVEVFNFKCPHCVKLHPAMEEWTKRMQGKYDIQSLPIVFSQQSDQPLRGFYAGQFLGRESDMKHAIFNAHFVDHINIDSPQELAFIAEGMKIDSVAFQNHMNSFGVQSKIAQGKARSQAFGVTSTPTLVVNGRYRVTPGRHDQGSYERLFAIVEALTAQ